MAFSKETMDAIRREAAAQGIRSPSAISVALREQLVDEKTGNMDGRTKTYWCAGRVVDRGMATPLPGAVMLNQLDAAGPVAVGAAQYVGVEPPSADAAKPLLPAARVALTRNNRAHLVIPLPHSRKPPEVPDAWVDLYIFRTEADATAHALTLKPGKVF